MPYSASPSSGTGTPSTLRMSPPTGRCPSAARTSGAGERKHHQWNPDTIAKLQHAARTNDRDVYRSFARLSNDQSRKIATLRGLLEFKEDLGPVPIDEVETGLGNR